MKALIRNQRPFYYCLYVGKEHIRDSDGNRTSEKRIIYSQPVLMMANISPATGYSGTEMFGNLDNYDKVIVTDWMDCPIDENAVLFIDKDPEFSKNSTYEVIESTTLYGEDQVSETVYTSPKNDYIVRRVAKSLNSISIAVSKVSVG